MANKNKNIIKKMRQKLHDLRVAVNKYEIQYIASDLSMYSGGKLTLILPDLLDLLQTASIRHTLSAVSDLITKTGRNARQAVPIYMDRLLTNDQWLISGYRYALTQLGWTYKSKPDELATYIAELEAVIAEDDREIAKREAYTYQLAELVDHADMRITGDDVRTLLEKQIAISMNIYNSLSWASNKSEEIKQLTDALYNLNNRINRRKALQGTIHELIEHQKTGWHNHQQLYNVICTFLKQNPTVKQVKIFGSRSNKTYRADSDLDIALVLQTKETEEALDIYRQHNQNWHQWFDEQLPYEIDLNLYVDEETTPEVHKGIHSGKGHSTYEA